MSPSFPALAAWTALAVAQPAEPPTVDEIRTTARALLQPMCGAQCDVIDVRVKTKRAAPTGAVEPGFDDVAPPRVVPSEIDLRVLFDSKLTPEYRRFVKDRLRHRVSELGFPVLISEEVRLFPDPPKLETPEPPAPPASERPEPPPPPEETREAPRPAPEPERPRLEDALFLRLIEAVPLLLAFGLLAWLVLAVLRRMERLLGRGPEAPARADDEVLLPEVIEEGSRISEAPSPLPPPNAERLAQDLRAHRGSTRRIFKRLLVRGDHDAVARAVAILGDFVVKDLAPDPTVRTALAAAGERTAEILRAPVTDEENFEVLRMIQAELVADRVAHRADDVRPEFEGLLGWSPEAFAALLARLPPRHGLILLRHAPQHLSESYLLGLAPNARTDTVRKLLCAPPAEPEEIESLADSVEAQKDAALVGGYEADHIVDLLDSLSASEQDGVVADLESTRPDFVRRNLGSLPVESTLLRVSDAALEAAWSTVPLDAWVAYLRAAPEAIRARGVATCPARLHEALTEELALRVAPDPDRAQQARRRIVRAALAGEARGGGAEVGLTVVEKTMAQRPGGSE